MFLAHDMKGFKSGLVAIMWSGVVDELVGHVPGK